MYEGKGFALPESELEKHKIPEDQLAKINEAAVRSTKSSEKWPSVSEQAIEIFRSGKLPSFPERDRKIIMERVEELLKDKEFRTKAMRFWEDQEEKDLAIGLSERLMEEMRKQGQ